MASTASCLLLHKRAERVDVALMEKGRLNTGDHVALVYPPGEGDDKQANRQTNRRETDRQTHRQDRYTQADRQMDTERHMHIQTDSHPETQPTKHTNSQPCSLSCMFCSLSGQAST